MDELAIIGCKRASITVVRNYAPTRVETKLLAHAFDIVRGCATSESALPAYRQGHDDLTSNKSKIEDSQAENEVDLANHDQRIGLEAAA